MSRRGTPLAARPAALARSVARLTTAQVWPFDRATAAGHCVQGRAPGNPAAAEVARFLA